MSTERNIDKRFKLLCAEILEESIKKIALTYSVSTTEFYDTVHELSFSPESLMVEEAIKIGVDIDFDDIEGYNRIEETTKSKLRLYRIANRLAVNPAQDKKDKLKIDSEILAKPKIYDDCIGSAMVTTYSAVSDIIWDLLFNKLGATNIKRALQAETRIDRLSNRQCFSFTEFAMFVCLYMALNRASVDVLNRPMETANQKRKLKGRMQRIKQWLVSDELRDSLVKTFVDLVAEFNEEKYSVLIDKHVRDYWLSGEKRHLKYLDYAKEQRYLEVPRIKYRGKALICETEAMNFEDGAPLVTVKWKETTPENEGENIPSDKLEQLIYDFSIENDRVQVYQEFFLHVLPVAQMMSLRIVPKDLLETDKTKKEFDLRFYLMRSNKTDKITAEHLRRQDAQSYVIAIDEYQLANKVSDVIDIYIDAVLSSVVTFLECLPEANIAGEKTLQEYFNSL